MIRVTIEVDDWGHDFRIQREEAMQTGVPATKTLDNVVRQAQAAMIGALTTSPTDVIDR